MRVLIVFAHPDRRSFCGALLSRLEAGLRAAGHEVEVADLYAERFDPVEHKYFWAVPNVPPETRQRYLEEAYELGRQYAN